MKPCLHTMEYKQTNACLELDLEGLFLGKLRLAAVVEHFARMQKNG